MSEDHGLELAAQTITSGMVAGASLTNPDLAAAAIFLAPTAELYLQQALGALGFRRRRHVIETMTTAADVRSETIDELITRALEDDDGQKLFVRVATAAQDAALREKRVALGRALAAGLDGGESAVNDELLFVRAIDDLDAPHIQLLRVMTGSRPGTGPMAGHALTDGWTRANLSPLVPTLSRHLPSLMATLEQHGLIEWQNEGTWAGITERSYNVTSAGRACLERLALDAENETRNDGPEPAPVD